MTLLSALKTQSFKHYLPNSLQNAKLRVIKEVQEVQVIH